MVVRKQSRRVDGMKNDEENRLQNKLVFTLK